jgi:hypothetical protein
MALLFQGLKDTLKGALYATEGTLGVFEGASKVGAAGFGTGKQVVNKVSSVLGGGYIKNPETGRMVLRNGRIGKKILANA